MKCTRSHWGSGVKPIHGKLMIQTRITQKIHKGNGRRGMPLYVGMILAAVVDVKRRWMIAAALALALSFLIVSRAPGRASGADARDTVAIPAPRDVTVSHQLVTATPISAAMVMPSISRAPAPTLVARSERRRTTAPSSDIVARARRALLGDGRHRPEPFPRIK